MKPRLVLWGNNAQDEKILVALELLEAENQVRILTFADAVVTDEFYETTMRTDWREGKEVEMPEHQTEIRDMRAADTLLPEHIKVQRTDLLETKKLEWQVLVLGAKMNAQFQSELEAIKDKVERLESYDRGTWENLKGFWDKVQKNVREGIFSRKYEQDLRKTTDGLFVQMKDLRKRMDEHFKAQAQGNFDEFSQVLEGLEKRIQEGGKLNGIFNELKKLQSKFHNTKFTKDLREKVWQRMDKAFKDVKDKKYGGNSPSGEKGKDGHKSYENSPLGRIARRYDGLLKAIERSEHTRNRDLKDLEFEKRRVANTDGQLEAQIRQAKILMIQQRLQLKEDKLKDLYKTREQLEKQKASMEEKERLDKIRREKEADARAKIQEQVNQTTENLDPEMEAKAKAAAEKIKAAKQAKKSEPASKTHSPQNELFPLVPPLVTGDTPQSQATEEDSSEPEKLEAMNPKETEKKGLFDSLKEKATELREEIREELEEIQEDLRPYMEKGKEIVEEAKEEISEFIDEVKEEARELLHGDDDDKDDKDK